jgi:hypothetical protein
VGSYRSSRWCICDLCDASSCIHAVRPLRTSTAAVVNMQPVSWQVRPSVLAVDAQSCAFLSTTDAGQRSQACVVLQGILGNTFCSPLSHA